MRPLEGVRVLEAGGIGPTPYGGMILADMGADVVALQRPGAENDLWAIPPRFDFLNRGKRKVEANLADPRQRQAVQELSQSADILIEGFRPGVMERLGLGPDVCMAANPRLVYARLTGWGQAGPLSQAAGHDLNYIALAGALGSFGAEGQPPPIPLNLVGDFAGGTLFAINGILAALYVTARTGAGQVLDCAMVDGVAHLMAVFHGQAQAGLWREERGTNIVDGGAPFYGVYRTSDGHYVTLAAAEPQFYREFLEKTGLAEEDLPPQYDLSGWDRLRTRFARLFETRTRAEWCELLEGTDTCFSPVLSMSESTRHPHMKARGVFADVDGVAQPVAAPRFSRSPNPKPKPLPLGNSTLEDVQASWRDTPRARPVALAIDEPPRPVSEQVMRSADGRS